MLYYTSSYEEMKQQLEEQRAAHEQERRCVIVAAGRQSAFRFVAKHLGSQMVRIGTWLEDVGHAGVLVSDAGSPNR